MKQGGAMEVIGDEEDDPIPNELDNALVQLIPAIAACGGDPTLKSYLDLATFEKLAGTVLGGGGGSGGGTRRRLDERVSGEIEVAFRHCMHEAGLVLAGAAEEGDGAAARAGIGKEGLAAAVGVGARGAEEEKEAMAERMAEPLGILSLSLEFVSKEAELDESGTGISPALSGLPLLLLEDFLESQGRKVCKVFWWKWVEPNSERLTKLIGMKNNANLTLIRLCKKLAQRMSKTDDSSFCGQIHLFLAKALEFFERSGLNVTGGSNLANVTAFEDEEQFRRTMMGFETAQGGAGNVGDPMEVDSAGAAGGGEKKAGAASEEFAVDYPLYQSFWRLQNYALQQDKAVKGGEAKETWEALLADVDKILGAFEANAFSEHDLRLARERWAAEGAPAFSSPAAAKGTAAPGSTSKRKRGGGGGAAPAPAGTGGAGAMEVEARGAAGGGGGGGPVYFGLKYLTSSRLLRLQLRDPTLRLQVLTQWLILAASLKSKVASTKDCPNSVEDLKPRIDLAKQLVRATPPRGEEYLSMLQTVLNRENNWTQWKDLKKCQTFKPVAVEEEQQAEKDKAAGVVAPAPTFPNKRPRPSASVASAERAKYAPLGAGFPLEKMVKKLRAGVPSSEEHLEDQRMCAEDPETPAEELPSASPLYTWRALRLLGRENPSNLVGCHDGDLVKAMKRLDKAKEDATAAATAAAEAGAQAAVAVAAKPELEQPSKPEAAEAQEKTSEGDVKAVATDGNEDGEVEIKRESADQAASSTNGEAGGGAKGGEPEGRTAKGQAGNAAAVHPDPSPTTPAKDADVAVAGSSPKDPSASSSGGGEKQTEDVTGLLAPVAETKPAAAELMVAKKAAPSPAKGTRRKTEGAENGEGK